MSNADNEKTEILQRADQDLASVEEMLRAMTEAWRAILDDPALSDDMDSSVERIAVLHSLIHDMGLPSMSLAAMLAALIHRSVEPPTSAQQLEEMFNARS